MRLLPFAMVSSRPAQSGWTVRPKFHHGTKTAQRLVGQRGANRRRYCGVGGLVTDDHVMVAEELADAAAKVTRRYFRTPFDVDCKADESPVTIADREAEIAMRAIIKERFPNHSVFGEEKGLEIGQGDDKHFMWVLDPIDGTKSFITGKPVFGTLIALTYNGSPILGIIDQSIQKERWLGVVGRQTLFNNQPVSTRHCSELSNAYMYTTAPEAYFGPTLQPYKKMVEGVKTVVYGCDCYSSGLLASGFCDVVIEGLMKPYDFMALVPVVQGAGGVMTDWNGADLVWDGVRNGLGGGAEETVAAGSVELHRQALETLGCKTGDGG